MSVQQWLMQASRISAVLVIGLLIVNLMWPVGSVRWEFVPEKAIALFVGFGGWIGFEVRTLYLLHQKATRPERGAQEQAAETASRPPELSKHDQALLDRFEALIDDDALYFLRHHNFGGAFWRRSLDPFFEFADTWKGGRFKFADAEIEARFSRVRDAASEFAEVAATKTHYAHGNNEMGTVKLDPHGRRLNPDADRIEEEAARAVNDAATALVAAIDDFSSFAHGSRERAEGGTGGSPEPVIT